MIICRMISGFHQIIRHQILEIQFLKVRKSRKFGTKFFIEIRKMNKRSRMRKIILMRIEIKNHLYRMMEWNSMLYFKRFVNFERFDQKSGSIGFDQRKSCCTKSIFLFQVKLKTNMKIIRFFPFD